VNAPCTVVIAAPHLLPALKARLAHPSSGHPAGDVIEFGDTEALPALEAIARRRPSVIVLERLFAAAPRGAALINRIKADPSLHASEIRVMSHDSDYVRVSPRKAAATAGGLDQRGTRRVPRFKVRPSADATVDGQQAQIIDLSTVGAQVMSAAVMKPNQRVKVSLGDDLGTLRFEADVAWASFEMSAKGGARYRAGLAFLDADPGALEAYALRHKAG
jgi:hypothetical protein